MLCPSAMPCDPSQRPPLTRLQSALFASPPASPPQLSSANSLGGIFTACRNLQALLTSPPPTLQQSALFNNSPPVTPPASSHAQLPTPPMSHTPAPLKLRLRSRRSAENCIAPDQRKKVVKRAPPPRGLNKRRRAVDDDMGRDSDDDDGAESDLDIGASADASYAAHEEDAEPSRPSTPKRARIAPQVLPLGLERSDFHALDGMAEGDNNTLEETSPNGEDWTTEDDRILVELVLEKLKLTKSEWQDCARNLGKDRHSLGRRWRTLMANGDVGLKSRGSRSRAKIHGTWR